ncbi:hypothetical protein BDN72DRAFT_410812 [Pluteus cervinus]|uniref:Uncharacterized protein n=1 Tax=Pluteus cervinus TaxID=181527 RepID=A0ACD3B0P9_9AGAR|nr:hypothetical protein BDN72DRAFT_410812 [Pluteus cervinus]
MGYAHYDGRRLAEMRGRIQHAIQMVSKWTPEESEPTRMQQVMLNGRAITADMAMGGSQAASSPPPRSPREVLMEAQLRNRSRSKSHSERDRERESRRRRSGSHSRSGGSNQPSPTGLHYLDPHSSPRTENPPSSSSNHRHSTVSRHSSGSRQTTPQHSPWNPTSDRMKTIEEFDRSVSTLLRSNQTPSRSQNNQPAWRHSRHQSAAPALTSSSSQGPSHHTSSSSSQPQAPKETADSARKKYEREKRDKERHKQRVTDRHRKWKSRDYGSGYFGRPEDTDDTDDTNDEADSADSEEEESEATESESEDEVVTGRGDLVKSGPSSTSRDIHRSISAHNVRPPSMTMTAPSPLKQQATMPTLSALPPGFQPFGASTPNPQQHQQHQQMFSSMPPGPTPSAAALAAGMQRMSLTSPVPPTLPNSSIPSSMQPVPPTLPSASNTSTSSHSHGLPPQVPSFGIPQLRMPTAAALYQQQLQHQMGGGGGTTTPIPRPLTAMSSLSSVLGSGPMATPPATGTFQQGFPFPGPPYMHMPVHGFGHQQQPQMQVQVQHQHQQPQHQSHGHGHGHGHSMHAHSHVRTGHGGHTQSMSALPPLSGFSLHGPTMMTRLDELSPILPTLPPPSNALGLY